MKRFPVPDVPPPADMAFRARLRTRWADGDVQGVLNNAVYLTLFEEARHAYFGRLGLLEDGQFPFLLLQTNVRFLEPGYGGRDVEVQLATTGLGTTSFSQAYRVCDLDSGAVWCEGEAVLVTVDEAGAARPMGERFRSSIEQS